MNLLRVRPAHESSRHAELLEQPSDHVVGIRRRADVVKSGDDSGQRFLDIMDSLSGIALTLRIQATLASQHFFTVEISKGVERRAGTPLRRCHEARESNPRRGHVQILKSSLPTWRAGCQRFTRVGRHHDVRRETANPHADPTAAPPSTTSAISGPDRKLTTSMAPSEASVGPHQASAVR